MKTKLLEFWLKIRKGVIIAGLILAFLTISFIAGKCSTKAQRQQLLSNITALNSDIKETVVTIEGLKNTVFEKDAVILSQKDAISTGILENERLKKLHLSELLTNTELTGTIKILRDSLKLPPNTVFVTIKDTTGVARDYVRLPFELLRIADKYVTLNAGMNLNKTAYYNLSVPFAGTVSVGYVKDGLFKKSVPRGIFTSENPYLTIDDMNVLIVQEPDKLIDKWYVHAGAGILIFEGLKLLFK